MLKIERFLHGIFRIETSTVDEQREAAQELRNWIEGARQEYPIIGLMDNLPSGIERQRTRRVFILNRCVRTTYYLDPQCISTEFLSKKVI